ncbi:putative reverse transcriptase domain-containing protein [Tanacetum coccineum]
MQKEKEQQDKLNAVKARLLYGDESGRNPRNHEESHYSESKTSTARTKPRRKHGGRHSRSPSPVASVFRRLRRNIPPSPGHRPRKEGGVFNRGTSPRGNIRYSESEDSEGGHSKSKSKRHRTRMPSHVKTYDRSGDPEDHLKLFQSAAKTERWAMPTWCHMFNSMLTGNARVWFDKLPKESIDSYEDLRAAFRENYLQQTKHIKDPVEIHHIKQRDRESTEDFMERYKAKVLDVEGAPECMKIFGFMHWITHPELIKRLYEKIPRSMDEMYRVTTSFLQGEVAAFSHSRKKAPTPWRQPEGGKSQTSKRVLKTSKGRIGSQIAEKADRGDDQVRQIVAIHQRIKTERQTKGTKEGGNGRKGQAPSNPDGSIIGEEFLFSRIMPPRRLKKKSIKRLVEKRVAKAIEEYEKSRANLDSAGSSGGNPGNAGGTMNVHGCSHKTFMNGKPHTFNGTEGVVGLRRWIEKVEQVFETCKCAEEDKVMFAASTFEGRALTWWNGNVHTLGLVNANHIPWTEFKTMMTTEYCPATEIQRMEQELWTLTLKGDDIEAYNNRFHELALMCPELVPTEKKKIERYTRGFPERIKGNITSSKPATLHDAINMARELVEQAVQGKATRIGESNKRKWEDHQRNTNNNNNNPNNNNNNNNRNRNNNYHQQQNRRQETARAYAAAPTENRGYAGNLPKCNRCNFHHSGRCPPKCQKCQRTGHLEKDCRVRVPSVGVNPLQDMTCYGCGEKGHFKDKCPKRRNQPNEGAHGRAYVVVENPQQNPNVVTGTFLLNDHYACILFDSGAEKSFVSSAFTPFIDIAPTALNTSYEVELADGKVVSTNTVLRGCTFVLLNHVFKIDLLPTRLGSFDVLIGMDWLSYHRAVIDCYEKIVRIPLPNGEILKVQGKRPEKDPGSLVCIKADEKKLDDIRVVRDIPEVLPDDLSGLPPVREIEFRIDLIPGASPVVKSPYRLAPSEMLELSNQLKEL